MQGPFLAVLGISEDEESIVGYESRVVDRQNVGVLATDPRDLRDENKQFFKDIVLKSDD